MKTFQHSASAAMAQTRKTEILPMPYRHEIKYEVSIDVATRLRHAAVAFLHADAHAAADGSYFIKSLYFDTPFHSDYTDTELGVKQRRKIRLRTYGDAGEIYHLEVKHKVGEVAKKYSCTLTKAQAQRVAQGDYSEILTLPDEYAPAIYQVMVSECYRPVFVVSYLRYAFCEQAGEFRLTFDEQMSYSPNPDMLFAPLLPMGYLSKDVVIEVKYDEFVPRWVTEFLVSNKLTASSHSKYGKAFVHVFD
ncbi:MAG: polyphosphate polymerase domain-containing protein [Faecalibacterium sp.]